MKNFLPKALTKKIKLNQFCHVKETFRFKSIPKLMDTVRYWVPSKEKSVDYDDVIQIHPHKILLITLKSTMLVLQFSSLSHPVEKMSL